MVQNYLSDYDPAEIVVNFGAVTLGGFEEGTFVSIVKTEDTWSGKSGIGGDYMYVKNNSGEYIVTLTLMANSESNDFLSGVYIGDLTLSGLGLLPLSITNTLGRELFICASARIMKIADMNFGSDPQPKVWRFLCHGVVPAYAGGHWT